MWRTLHAVRTVLLEEIVTGVAPSAACVSKETPVVNWKVASKPIPIDMNTFIVSPRENIRVLTVNGTSTPSIRVRSQEIGSTRGSIGP